jgi:D-sedoheptulose 7-phosphate isomerase
VSTRDALLRRVQVELQEAAALKNQVALAAAPDLAEGARMWVATLKAGGTILFCGNGGSAADCQHAATELVVRLKKNRRAFAALALTTDTSLLTAGANDLGFESVFRRQVEALGKAGDLLVALSTSGKSANVLAAARQAHKQKLRVLALTGPAGSPLARLADRALCVPSDDTQRIQEVHILYLHILCRQTEHLLLHR